MKYIGGSLKTTALCAALIVSCTLFSLGSADISFAADSSGNVIFGTEAPWLFLGGGDGQPLETYERINLFTNSELASIGSNLDSLRKDVEDAGMEFILLIAPDKEEIYGPDYMPSSVTVNDGPTCTEQLLAYLADSYPDLTVIYPADEMNAAKDAIALFEQEDLEYLSEPIYTEEGPGAVTYAKWPEDVPEEYRWLNGVKSIYYESDTHWNYVGAWIAASEVLKTAAEKTGREWEVPTVTFPNIGVLEGDLQELAGLGEEYSSIIYAPDITATYQVTESYRNPDNSDLIRTGSTNDSEDVLPLKIYMTGDSFRLSMIQFIEQFTEECLVTSRYYFDTEDLAAQAPQVFVYEIAERYIHELNVLPGYNTVALSWSPDWKEDTDLTVSGLQTARSSYGIRAAAASDVVVGTEVPWLFFSADDGQPLQTYQRTNPLSDAELAVIGENVDSLRRDVEGAGMEFILFIAPDKEEIYGPDYMPSYITVNGGPTCTEQLLTYLADSYPDLTVIYPANALIAAKNAIAGVEQETVEYETVPIYTDEGPGAVTYEEQPVYVPEDYTWLEGVKSVYYETDTHWNDVGGWIGAAELLKTVARKTELEWEVPVITFFYAGTFDGDLKRQSGLGAEYYSLLYQSDMIQTYNVTRYVAVSDTDPIWIGSINDSGDALPVSLYVTGDSLRLSMSSYLAQYTRNCVVTSRYYFDTEDLAAQAPQVFVYEIAERYLRELAVLPGYNTVALQWPAGS